MNNQYLPWYRIVQCLNILLPAEMLFSEPEIKGQSLKRVDIDHP